MSLKKYLALGAMLGFSYSMPVAASTSEEDNEQAPKKITLFSAKSIANLLSPKNKDPDNYSYYDCFGAAQEREKSVQRKLTEKLQTQMSTQGWGLAMIEWIKENSKSPLTQDQGIFLVETLESFSQKRQNEVIENATLILKTYRYLASAKLSENIPFMDIVLLDTADLKKINEICGLHHNNVLLEEEIAKSTAKQILWAAQQKARFAGTDVESSDFEKKLIAIDQKLSKHDTEPSQRVELNSNN